MRKDKIRKYLKSNPDLFEQARNQTAEFHGASIPDKDIPPMKWLIEDNPEFRSREARKGNAKRPWYLSKGLWIPVTICAVLALLFSTTPWGRVTASKAYTTVVKFFAGGSSLQSGQGDKTITATNQVQGVINYESIDEVREALGRKIALNTSEYDIQSIEVAHDGFYIIIETLYNNGKNTIILRQTIQDTKTEWSNSQSYNFDQTFHEKMTDGSEAVGYVNAHNAYAVIYKSDMMLEIISKDIQEDGFLEFIRNIKVL